MHLYFHRTLFNELVQKCIKDVASCLFGEYGSDVLSLAVQSLTDVFQDDGTRVFVTG